MPRIRLHALDHYAFEGHHVVRATDLNYGNHLAHDALVSRIHDERVRLFHEKGFSEMDLGDGKTGIVVTGLQVQYKSEAFLHDSLTISTQFDEFGKFGFRMFHHVHKAHSTIALVEIDCAAFNFKESALSRIPKSFIDCFYPAR